MATSSSLRHSRGSQSARAGRAAPAVRSRRHSGCRPARPALSFPSRSSRPRSRPAPVMVEISVLPSWTLARKGRRAFPPRVTVRLGRAHAATSRTRVTRLLGPGSSSRALEPPRGRLPSGGRPSPARRDREDRVGNGFSTGSFSEKARVRPPTVAAHEKANVVRLSPKREKKPTTPLATLEPATVRALNRARPPPSLPIRADTRDRAAPPLPDTPGRRVARVASRRAVGEKAARRFAPRRKENKAVRRRVSRPRRVAAVRRGVRERNEPDPKPEAREDTRDRDARACRARRAQRRPAGGGGGGGGGGGRVFAPAKTK